jgi:tetratricopeptide (TPR) repeat protein
MTQASARKQLNKNVVVGLGLFFFLAIIAVSAVMIRQLQRRDPKHFVSLAEQYAAAEQWRDAALMYERAADRGDDPSFLVPCGEMLLNDGEVRLAADRWRRALIQNPDLVPAHVKLVTLFLEYARLESAVANWRLVEEAAERFLNVEESLKTPAEEALAHHAYGLALLSLAETDDSYAARGESHVKSAITAAPEIPDYVIDLAFHYFRKKREADAEQFLREGLTSFADGAAGAKLRSAYAKVLASPPKEDLGEARKLLEESVAMAAGDRAALLEAKLAYAQFLSQQWARAVQQQSAEAPSFFDQAETLLKECIHTDPDQVEASFHLARLYYAAGRTDETVQVCEGPLSRPIPRKGLDAVRKRLTLFNMMNHVSEACAVLAAAATRRGDDAGRDEWLKKAEGFVARALGEYPSHPKALAQSARIKLERGQDRAALEDLRAADDGNRGAGIIDWPVKTALARLHLKLGETGAAEAVLDEIRDAAQRLRPDDTEFWLLYGQVLLLNNERERALSVCETVLQFAPNHREALRLKAAVYERMGRLAEAGAIHAQLTGSPAVRAIMEFRELERAGNAEKGMQGLLAVLEQDPADPRLVAFVVRALWTLDRKEEAASVSKRALSVKPEDEDLQKLAVFTRADLTADQRDEALLQILESESDGFERALGLAAYFTRKDEFEEALRHVGDAERHLLERDTPLAKAATASQQREVLLQKMALGAQLKNEKAMAEARDAAAKFDVDGAEGKSVLGMYHLYRDETELALRAFREAVESQPTDARSLTYLGHCLLNTGRVDDAQSYFERAIRVNPNFALAHRGMGALAQRRGDQEAYDRAFEVCRRLTPDDPWVQAELEARNERAAPLEAIVRREAALARNPDDFDNLRRLAALCEQAQDLAKADSYYEQLLTARPDDEAAAMTVAKYYRRTNRPERGLDILRGFAQTRSNAEQRANASILVAGHHLNQGDPAAAEATLLAAADIAMTLEVAQSLSELYVRSLNQPEKALPWFARAAELARQRRSPLLPQILAGRIACLLHRGVNDLETAHRLVEDLRREFPDEPRALYWESELHARQGRLEKSAEILTDYLRITPDDSYVLFQRARLYLALGRTALAMADLERLKQTAPLALDLEPRILLARLNLRAGRLEVAIRELETLVQQAADSEPAAVELVRAYVRARRFDDADRLFTARINRTTGESQANWLFLRSLASLEAGQTDRALVDARRAAEVTGHAPAALRNVLDLYSRAGRFAEGARYYEERADGSRPDVSLEAQYAMMLARAGRTPESVSVFRRAMDRALNESSAAVRSVTDRLREAFPADDGLAAFESTPAEPRLRRADDRIRIRLYRLADRIPEAEELLDRALAEAQTDAERAAILYEKGEMYQLRGNAGEAKVAYEESLRYDGRNWVTLNNLAFLLAEELGQLREALPFAQQAVALADTADTLDTLGWIYTGLGNYPMAVAELSRAVRLDPTQALLLYHLGETYRRNGQFLEADDLLQRAKEVAEAAQDQSLVEKLEVSIAKTRDRDTM